MRCLEMLSRAVHDRSTEVLLMHMYSCTADDIIHSSDRLQIHLYPIAALGTQAIFEVVCSLIARPPFWCIFEAIICPSEMMQCSVCLKSSASNDFPAADTFSNVLLTICSL